MNQMKWNRIIKHCHSLSGWLKRCWGGETSQKKVDGRIHAIAVLFGFTSSTHLHVLTSSRMHPGLHRPPGIWLFPSLFLGIKEWNAHQFAATSVTPQKNWPFQHVQICNPFIVQSPIITCHVTKHPLDTEMRWIPKEMIHSDSQTSVPQSHTQRLI